MKELILYIARKSEEDERFGAVKLNKILFFSDFLSYAETGKAITGQAYQKLDFGPAPNQLLPLRDAMVAAGHLAIQERKHFGYPQQRPIALREPDLTTFTGAEIELVNFVMEKLAGLSATEVSELSHRFSGWQLAETKEEIPYSVALLATPEPESLTEAELKRAHVLAKKAEQLAAA